MILWQRDMFDSDQDVLFIPSERAIKPKSSTKSKAGDSDPVSLVNNSAMPLPLLFPELFQEDQPDLQDMPEEGTLVWSDDGIATLCGVVLNDAIYGLISPKCGTESRELGIEWLFKQELTPFSFRHCCIMLDVSPERMLAGIFRQVVTRRSYLRRCSKLSHKEHELLLWLEKQGWLDEVVSMAMTDEDDGWDFNPTATYAHYERQLSRPNNYLY